MIKLQEIFSNFQFKNKNNKLLFHSFIIIEKLKSNQFLTS